MTKAEQFKARKRLVREIAEALKVPTPKASEASVFAGFEAAKALDGYQWHPHQSERLQKEGK